MLVKAYAKINISLDVVGKREDGYHLLEMIMQNIELYDYLELHKKREGIKVECSKAYVPEDDRNLAYKAAKIFKEAYNIKEGISIKIVKNIPVAAGLAGGSSDAAAVLVAMNEIFEKGATTEELCKMGLQIGSDVPYCIMGGTALCKGVGEEVTPLDAFKGHILVLVKPNFGVSTKDVYKSLDINRIYKHPETESLIEAMKNQDIKYVSENMKNVLENVTLKKHTVLREIKEKMLKMGALGSMMSGSGPTIFAFYDDMLKAQKCYDYFKERYSEVFITRTI